MLLLTLTVWPTIAGSALTAGPAFLGIVCSYLLVTSVYSWVLKRHVLLDVIALGGLYALRVLAGAVAIGVQVTPWLLAFCVFIFLSLALVNLIIAADKEAETQKSCDVARSVEGLITEGEEALVKSLPYIEGAGSGQKGTYDQLKTYLGGQKPRTASMIRVYCK